MGKLLSFLLALIAFGAVPGAAHAQFAQGAASQDPCVAYGSLTTSIEQLVEDPSAWRCDGSRIELAAERVFLRFPLADAPDEVTHLLSRRSAMGGLELAVLDSDGALRSRYFAPDQLDGAHMGDRFMAPLPDITEDSTQIIAAFDELTQTITAERAQLSAGDPGFEPANFKLLLGIALICGMVIIPVAFNLVFYRVLREAFVLWHAVMAVAILCQILLSSGLYLQLVPITVPQAYVIMVLTVGLSISAGTMFCWSFIEPDKLDPRLRRLLPWGAALTMAVSIGHAAFPFAFRSVQGTLYFSVYIPHLLLVLACLADASRKGSRAAKFIIVGWTPLLLVCVLRLVSHLTPLMPPTDAWELFVVGSMVEVVATMVGVADRFMTIKRQRDRARAESQAMESIAERDPLTGLLNRRGLQARFKPLRAHGFNQFAVFDLDHFKQVNDRFGHAMGDKVLQSVARAVTGNPHIRAARFGGEEFVVVMRGAGAAKQAERLRQAITRRIAIDLPGLDIAVTASMGLVELPLKHSQYIGFEELYQQADRLLYEAKRTGRNKLLSEKLVLFERRRRPRGPDGLSHAA